jgi:hypothetical protein
MAKLKAGTVRNLQTDTLAGAMDAEFVALWGSLKDTALPTDVRAVEDRRMMFVAIARGMLAYLHDHRNDIETTEESTGVSGSEHDHQLEFDWE